MGKKKREIPIFGLPIIETHCHLDFLKNEPLADIVKKSREIGVESIITIAVNPNNLNTVVDLTDEYDFIYGTQGVHPHNANLWDGEVEETIGRNARAEKIVAIGEIGLDYYYNKSPREKQIEVFEKQLEMAIEADLPVVIHTRDADEDTRAVLKNIAPKMKKKGVIHSYTSGIELAAFCLDMGFYLGFNGIITFKNADNVREVAKITPEDRLLIETDAPFLTPDPYRGRENGPFYLPFIAEKLAEVKNLPVESVLKSTYDNSRLLFQI